MAGCKKNNKKEKRQIYSFTHHHSHSNAQNFSNVTGETPSKHMSIYENPNINQATNKYPIYFLYLFDSKRLADSESTILVLHLQQFVWIWLIRSLSNSQNIDEYHHEVEDDFLVNCCNTSFHHPSLHLGSSWANNKIAQ